jgi:hypothetical protein
MTMMVWALFQAQAAEPLVIEGNLAKREFTCAAGQQVTIQGASLQITLEGDCGAVHVQGSANTVTTDGVASIRVDGASNTVTWKRNLSGVAKLPVQTTGVTNKVRQAN